MADNTTIVVNTTALRQTPNILELLMKGPWNVMPDFVPTLIVMTTLIITLGLVSNMLMVSIWKSPKLHTVANSFVIFMCLTDLCRILHIFAFDLVSGIAGRWIYDRRGTCTYSAFMVTYAGKATGLSFCILSLNRVIMITYQKMYRKVFNSRSTTILLICVVLVSIAISLPVAIKGINIYVLYSDQTGSCYAYDHDPRKIFQTTNIFVAVILPSLVMIPSYSWIYYYVRRNRRRVAAHVTVHARPEAPLREELRSALTIFLTYITYCMCYVPFYSSYIAYLLGVDVPNDSQIHSTMSLSMGTPTGKRFSGFSERILS